VPRNKNKYSVFFKKKRTFAFVSWNKIHVCIINPIANRLKNNVTNPSEALVVYNFYGNGIIYRGEKKKKNVSGWMWCDVVKHIVIQCESFGKSIMFIVHLL